MYKYFKINDPLRPIIASLALVSLGLLFNYLSPEVTNVELGWMLAGERLRTGWLPYSETITTLAPLAQCVYALLDSLFGRSATAYRTVALIALLIQLLIFSNYLIQNEILKEKTYLSAIVLCSIFLAVPGFITAYPALLGNIFVVYGFSLLMQQMKKQLPEEDYFQSGALFGIASLFFFPFAILGIAGIVYLLIYSQTAPRKLAVMIFGLVFPIVCVICVFYWKNSLGYLLEFAIESVSIESSFTIPQWTLMLPFIIFLFANVFGIIKNRQLINYQLICRQLHGFWLLIGSTLVLLYGNKQTGGYGLIAVPLTFFVVQIFPEIKRKGLRGFIFSGTVIYGFSIGALFAFEKLSNPLNEKITKNCLSKSNKRTLVLDYNLGCYWGNIPSTRYLEWNSSKKYFSQPRDYKHLVDIFNAISTEQPEIIVDPSNYMEKVFYHLPNLESKYSKDLKGNCYFLISN